MNQLLDNQQSINDRQTSQQIDWNNTGTNTEQQEREQRTNKQFGTIEPGNQSSKERISKQMNERMYKCMNDG